VPTYADSVCGTAGVGEYGECAMELGLVNRASGWSFILLAIAAGAVFLQTDLEATSPRRVLILHQCHSGTNGGTHKRPGLLTTVYSYTRHYIDTNS